MVKRQIVNEIKACERIVNGRMVNLPLSENVKVILREYIAYLKKNDYELTNNSPLFPQKNNTAYTESQLRRHLMKFNKSEDRLDKGSAGGVRPC